MTINNKLLIRVLAFLLALTLFMVTLPIKSEVVVSAQTVDELQNEISKLQQEQQNLKKETTQLQSQIDKENEFQENQIKEIANVKEQLDLYQQQIDAVNVEINANVTEIDAKNVEIDEKNAEIDQKNAEIDQKNVEIDQKNLEIQQKELEYQKTEELFLKRLDAMYMAGSDNTVLALLFGAKSFSELLTITETLKSISKSDNDLMLEITTFKEQLQVLRSELETQKAEIETKKAEIEAKKAEIEAKKAEIEVTKQQNEAKKADIVAIQATFLTKSNELNSLLTASEQSEATMQATQLALDLKVADLEKDIVASQDEISELLKQHSTTEDATKPSYTPSTGYIWPTPGAGYVSSNFGPRWGTFHYGMDIAAPAGTTIVAAKTGTVVRVQSITYGYGKNIILSHGDGTYTMYAHCSAMYVSQGQVVQQGEKIAAVGSTGDSTGNHLHFEIRLGPNKTDAVNPASYVSR